MTDITLFGPVQISVFMLNYDKEYIQQCIEEASKFTGVNDYKTNVQAKMSEWNIWQQTETYNKILSDIMEILDKPSWVYNNEPIEKYYDMISGWIAEYNKGDFTFCHDHRPSYLSFVYFLKASDSSTPLVFDELNYRLEPRDGMLVLFPGHIKHHVPEHRSHDSRIVLAGNIGAKS